jgi:PTS system mannose-specific IIA component
LQHPAGIAETGLALGFPITMMGTLSFGGTPSNLAISVMSRPKVEVLAGVNLPMLVKLAKVRDECPLGEAVAAAQEAGRKYITIASRVLAGK